MSWVLFTTLEVSIWWELLQGSVEFLVESCFIECETRFCEKLHSATMEKLLINVLWLSWLKGLFELPAFNSPSLEDVLGKYQYMFDTLLSTSALTCMRKPSFSNMHFKRSCGIAATWLFGSNISVHTAIYRNCPYPMCWINLFLAQWKELHMHLYF